MVHHSGRVSIIGAGTLGGTIAYSLILSNKAKEILMVDMSQSIVQGQVLDLSEMIEEGSDLIVRAGTFKEAGQSSLVIITADVPVREDQDREDWLRRSRKFLISLTSAMSPTHSDIMILVASDPVDLYVQSFQHYLPHVSPNKIFGIGTTMATNRFRTWLREMTHEKVAISDAYVIGNPMDPVVIWNYAKVNDVSVTSFPLLCGQRSTLYEIVSSHRHYLICDRKARAWFAFAATVTRLAGELLSKSKGKGKLADSSVNKPWVLSVYVQKYDCCLSWPVTITTEGVEDLLDLPLTSDESAKIMNVVRSNLADLQISMSAKQ